MSADMCPVCGSTVRLISDREGTNHYQPAAERELGHLRCELAALRLEHADQLEAVVAEAERLRRQVRCLSQQVSADVDALRLAAHLAAAADALLDVTQAATPHVRLSAVAREIGNLHRTWRAWRDRKTAQRPEEVPDGSSSA